MRSEVGERIGGKAKGAGEEACCVVESGKIWR